MNDKICIDKPLHIDMLSYTPRTPGLRPKRKKKIKCPICGRKLRPRIRQCHDSGCWHMYVPVHKRKHWWKKGKKK